MSGRRAGSACQEPTSRARPSRSTTVTMQPSVRTGTTSWASRPSADTVSSSPVSSALTWASSAARAVARRAVSSASRRSVASSTYRARPSGPGQTRASTHRSGALRCGVSNVIGRPVLGGRPVGLLDDASRDAGEGLPQRLAEDLGAGAVHQPFGLGVDVAEPPLRVEEAEGRGHGLQEADQLASARSPAGPGTSPSRRSRLAHCARPHVRPPALVAPLLERPRRRDSPDGRGHGDCVDPAVRCQGGRGAARTRSRARDRVTLPSLSVTGYRRERRA